MKSQLALLHTVFVLFSSCMGQPEVQDKLVVHHNKLDDINSVRDIQKLLVKINSDYAEFKVDESLEYQDQYGGYNDSADHALALELKVKAWAKSDFDNNGYTDLLVVGNWYNHAVIVILDSGENKFYIKHITRRSFQEATFPVIAMIDSRPVILNYMEERHFGDQAGKKLKADTLIFQFGDFVEYHKAPAIHRIEKIEYSTGACFGTCPIFSMKINADRKGIFKGGSYNYPDGDYTGTIDSAHYNMLTGLLDYIHFTELDSSYAVGWTDDQDCTLMITYDDGKIKKIEDYGLLGTYGLNRVYDILFDLRDDQKWYDQKGKIRMREKNRRGQF
jgi:hypothetical protein